MLFDPHGLFSNSSHICQRIKKSLLPIGDEVSEEKIFRNNNTKIIKEHQERIITSEFHENFTMDRFHLAEHFNIVAEFF